MSGQLGAPMEFTEDVEQAAAVPAVSKGGVRITNEVPTKQVGIVTGGNRRITVFMVDKEAVFSIPHEQLRARWANVVVRPVSGKVMVYDLKGDTVARFADWAQAEKEFKAAGILDAVKTKLKANKERREREEKAARDKLAAQQAK